MPSLTIEQFESCVVVDPHSQRELQTTCVRLLEQEYAEIVIEYRAMCVALGHGSVYCQASKEGAKP